MILNILKNRSLSRIRKAKNILLYLSRRRGAKKSWKERHENVIHANSNYNDSCSEEVEISHEKIWSEFSGKIDLSTLRICKNISGTADPKIVPEDIFVSDIEPSLNIHQSVNYLSNKSFYNRWFGPGIFPEDILHRIEGEYYDENLNSIQRSDFIQKASKIKFPVVLKPNMGSYGGEGIHFVNNQEELLHHSEEKQNFVVQEKINQHDFFKQYNPLGLNTIRVYLYKSVRDQNIHVLAKAFRMGKDGSLDNETAGGIHTLIHADGKMNGYAVDKYGSKYYEHPNSHIKFTHIIPDNRGLENICRKVASQIFLVRLIGLDVCYDEKGNWRIIEVNTSGHTIRFSQYGGIPFFGEFTNEVIEFCKNNHWMMKG